MASLPSSRRAEVRLSQGLIDTPPDRQMAPALRPAVAERADAARPRRWPRAGGELALTALAFAFLFGRTVALLVGEWLTRPEAGHGLLLAGAAGWILWRDRGLAHPSRPAPGVGLAMVVLGSAVGVLAQVAAPSRLVARAGMLVVLAGLVVHAHGWVRLRRAWLPALLVLLAMPLPGSAVVGLALPLQLVASRIGAALLEARNVPVLLAGNVIRIPGHDLFVTEACSGLRSLASLVSLAVLAGGLWLRTGWSRAAVVLVAIPIAVVLNGVRIFLTGFLTFFVSPTAGQGFMHVTEGWLLFVVALAALGVAAWGIVAVESALLARGGRR